jgi:hypothetical protein
MDGMEWSFGWCGNGVLVCCGICGLIIRSRLGAD